MNEEGSMRGRVALKGELSLGVAPGAEARFTHLELTFEGTFAAPAQPMRLKLEGTHEELRKLRVASESIARILDLQPDATGEGSLSLLAHDAQVRALGEAAGATPELDAQALFANERWIRQLLDLTAYEAESIGTIVRG